MNILRRYLIFAWLTLLFVFGIQAAVAELPAETRWADPSSVRLDVEFPGNGYHATWELFRCDCGDLLIRSELSVPGEVESGETILVGGRVILTRGFQNEEESLQGASLDAPALMMQLVLTLLEKVAAAGPSATIESQTIAMEEADQPIYLDSGDAAGSFRAPWTVNGSIAPLTDTKRQFDLNFRFSTGNPGEELLGSMRLWGSAEYAPEAFPIAGDTELADWTITVRDPSDPAAAAVSDVASVDSLRKLLSRTK